MRYNLDLINKASQIYFHDQQTAKTLSNRNEI